MLRKETSTKTQSVLKKILDNMLQIRSIQDRFFNTNVTLLSKIDGLVVCPTTPETFSYDEETIHGNKQNQLVKKIKSEYGYIDYQTFQVTGIRYRPCCCNLFSYPSSYLLDQQEIHQRLKSISQLTEKEKLGSCEMLCCYIVDNFSRNYPKYNFKILCLKNYDHFFLQITEASTGNIYLLDPLLRVALPQQKHQGYFDILVMNKIIWPHNLQSTYSSSNNRTNNYPFAEIPTGIIEKTPALNMKKS